METQIIKIRWFVNAIRLICGIFSLLVMLSDLYGVAVDPLIYERVYTGEFLGENSYQSLFHLKLFRWIQCVLIMVYLSLVILHLTKLKNCKILTWTLRIIDVFIILYIGYSVHSFLIT